MSNSEDKLSVLGHLGELRKRLIRSVIAVAITSIISFIFYKQIFNILIRPVQDVSQDINFSLIFVEMTEMIGTLMRVCLVSGVILAMPFLTYELIMFISPALTGRERRYVYLILTHRQGKEICLSDTPLDSTNVCRRCHLWLFHHDTTSNKIFGDLRQ